MNNDGVLSICNHSYQDFSDFPNIWNTSQRTPMPLLYYWAGSLLRFQPSTKIDRHRKTRICSILEKKTLIHIKTTTASHLSATIHIKTSATFHLSAIIHMKTSATFHLSAIIHICEDFSDFPYSCTIRPTWNENPLPMLTQRRKVVGLEKSYPIAVEFIEWPSWKTTLVCSLFFHPHPNVIHIAQRQRLIYLQYFT